MLRARKKTPKMAKTQPLVGDPQQHWGYPWGGGEGSDKPTLPWGPSLNKSLGGTARSRALRLEVEMVVAPLSDASSSTPEGRRRHSSARGGGVTGTPLATTENADTLGATFRSCCHEPLAPSVCIPPPPTAIVE